MPLSEYRKKRKFANTPEPKPVIGKSGARIFVVQEHHSRRLHYDFRLEHGSVLKSWAIPRGPSMDPADRRLAVQTEDHPVEYARFEGTIPKGNYGAGRVIIWDSGTFESLAPFSDSYEKGNLKIDLRGSKISGMFALVRTSGKNWLLIKKRGEGEKIPERISSGKGPGEIWRIGPKNEEKWELEVEGRKVYVSNPGKVIFPKSLITKKELVSYYLLVSKMMLPLIEDRPVSMKRFPHGIHEKPFFQKNIPGYFPDWIKTESIRHGSGATEYVVCSDSASLAYLAGQVVEPNIWLSRIDMLEYPDRMIFDFDPEKDEYDDVVFGARLLKRILGRLGLESFVMSTGSRGVHVLVPLDRSLKFEKVASFARLIASSIEDSHPEKFTSRLHKSRRKAPVFIDTYRNAFSQTAIAPYAVRAIEHAPVAAPLRWNELKYFHPQRFAIRNMQERIKKGAVWEGFRQQSIKKALDKYK